WNFNYVALLASDSVSRCKVAFIRQGRVVGFEQHEVAGLNESLDAALKRFFDAPVENNPADRAYDEFCLVANFIVDPLQSVHLVPVDDFAAVVQRVSQKLQRKKKQPQEAQNTP